MPDLANRLDHEERVRRAILLLLGEYATRFIETSRFPEREFADDAAARIALILLPIYADAVDGMLASLSNDIASTVQRERVLSRGENWAARFSQTLADEIAATTAGKIRDWRQQKVPIDAAALAVIFGATRAISIAITEVSRTISAAEQIIRREVVRRGGPILIAYWHIWDDTACPEICKPLDGTAEFHWVRYQPGGPPAHTRCRCFVDWTPEGDYYGSLPWRGPRLNWG